MQPAHIELNLPDPITNYNRQQARERYLQRESFVQQHHPGFNLAYWRRIIRTPGRIERFGCHYGWSIDRINLTKALLISRMACIFVDHMIYRMIQTGLISPATGGPSREWEHQYRQFLRMFLRVQEIYDRRAIVKNMQRLHQYTQPPESLLNFRRAHWQLIERVVTPRLNADSAANLFSRLRISQHLTPDRIARRICFTAALYSDIQERLYHQQWMYAYSDCMLRLYEQIRQYPEILAALLRLP